MKRMQKRLFTLSGLFMVLAQVFVMAFSGIAAIAITQDETTKNLFEVNGSSATMGYELVDNETIKWTISLNKGGHDSPTRFMVDLQAGESSIVPEQIQSTNSEMVFESNYGDEHVQGGFSEQGTGSMNGETTISFVTTRQISNLVVTPKLVTVPVTNETVAMAATLTTESTTESTAESTTEVVDESQPTATSEPVNLLENVQNVTFEIPVVVEEDIEEDASVVTETPVTVKETEAVEEVVEGTKQTNTEPEDEIAGPVLFRGFSAFGGIQLTAAAIDPFQYYDDTNPAGIYPKHGTNKFSQSGAAVDTDDNVQNYNYGSDEDEKDSDNVPLFDISEGNLDFQTGYHEYGTSETGRINTKKTVKPVDGKNTFQIQLDTIGDAIRPFPEVDIVLVLDKSSSMNTVTKEGPTRWEQLQAAVEEFSTDILKENTEDNKQRIQIGLVNFASNASSSIMADVAKFTGGNNFSSDATSITNHSVVSGTPTIEQLGRYSATPTFIGVDAGLHLLHSGTGARETAKKVMITITDGVPTLRPTTGSTGYSFSTINPTNEGAYTRYSSTRFTGTPSNTITTDVQRSIDSNIAHITNQYANSAYSNDRYYSVGFHTDDEANAVVNALGPDGQFKASVVDDLVNALKQSVVRAIYTIGNATLNDPMSDFVEFDAATGITTEGLYLKDGVLTPGDYSFTAGIATDFDVENNQITATGVSLGQDEENGRQGYRITYQVRLKDGYDTGAFYPTNGVTYLANGEKGNHYYAVPSVRTEPTPVNVSFAKTNGSESLVGAQFRLKNDKYEYDSNVTEENGTVTFNDVLPGEYVLSEIQTPDGHITMDDMNVVVNRNGEITKKDGGALLDSVVNTLKPIDIRLKKVGPDGEALKGATFILQSQDSEDLNFTENTDVAGLHELADVAPGTYELIEDNAPDGYEVLGKIGDLTITEYGLATFTEVAGGTQNITVERDAEGERIQLDLSPIKNSLKPIDISLEKIGPDGNALKGATFILEQEFTKLTFAESQTTAGLHELKDVAPGTYDLIETVAPEGYEVLGKIGELVVSENGTVTFEKVTESTQDIKLVKTEGTRVLFTLSSIKNTLKPIDLSLNKVGPDGNALKGAEFILRQGETDWTFSEDEATAGLHELTDVAPGTYELIETKAPLGYKSLGKIGDLTIDANGQATFKKFAEEEPKSLSRTVEGRINIDLPFVTNDLKPFDLTVNKEDDLGEVLIGAEFTLTGPNNYKQVITSTSDDPISEFSFTGLTPGDYTLTETSTPEGYIGLTRAITVEISELGVVEVSGADEETLLTTGDQNNTISFTVTNKKKVPLPATGGAGTMLFVTIGVLALIATGLYFLQRKDREVA